MHTELTKTKEDYTAMQTEFAKILIVKDENIKLVSKIADQSEILGRLEARISVFEGNIDMSCMDQSADGDVIGSLIHGSVSGSELGGGQADGAEE